MNEEEGSARPETAPVTSKTRREESKSYNRNHLQVQDMLNLDLITPYNEPKD